VLIFLRIARRAAGPLVYALVATTLVHAQDTAFVSAVHLLVTEPDQSSRARTQLTAALGEWDRQIRALEAALDAGGAQAFERHLTLGLTYHRRGRLDEALQQFDAAAALRADASDVHLLRGLVLESAGRDRDAAVAFHAAWQRDEENPVKASLVLRAAHLDALDRTRAMDVLRKAFARILSGDHRPAAPPFQTVTLIPDTLARTPVVGAGAMGGVFSHLAAGRLDRAVAAFDAVAPRAPSGVEGALARAAAAEADGRLGDAVREYTTALTATLTGRHVLHVGLGRLFQVQGQFDASIEAFSHAARLSPNNPTIRRELAAAFVAAGRSDDAFVELVAALLIAPEDAESLAAVGQIYLDTDRPAEAIPVLQRVLAVRANRYETHYALATALSRVGRTADAAREFERFDRLSREALAARRRSVAGDTGPPEPSRKPR
jgi:tetratricopeptide (TPR) repeat protein